MLRSLIGYVRGAGSMAAGWSSRATPSSSTSPSACTTACTGRGRRRAAGRRRNALPTSAGAPPTRAALAETVRPGDVVILHDPQTAGMLPALRAACDVPLIWRAHIGLDLPNDLAREAWQLPHARTSRRPTRTCSRARRSRGRASTRQRVTVIPPSIDAFSPKNQGMSFTSVDRGAARRRPGRATTRSAPRGLRAARRQRRLRRATAREMLEEDAAPARQPAARAGLAVGSPQGSARRAGRLRRARARGRESPHLAARRARTSAPSPTTPRAPRCSPRSRRPGTSCPRPCAAASTSRCCRWRTPRRTPSSSTRSSGGPTSWPRRASPRASA